jgi:hypothetical protein
MWIAIPLILGVVAFCLLMEIREQTNEAWYDGYYHSDPVMLGHCVVRPEKHAPSEYYAQKHARKPRWLWRMMVRAWHRGKNQLAEDRRIARERTRENESA